MLPHYSRLPYHGKLPNILCSISFNTTDASSMAVRASAHPAGSYSWPGRSLRKFIILWGSHETIALIVSATAVSTSPSTPSTCQSSSSRQWRRLGSGSLPTDLSISQAMRFTAIRFSLLISPIDSCPLSHVQTTVKGCSQIKKTPASFLASGKRF